MPKRDAAGYNSARVVFYRGVFGAVRVKDNIKKKKETGPAGGYQKSSPTMVRVKLLSFSCVLNTSITRNIVNVRRLSYLFNFEDHCSV